MRTHILLFSLIFGFIFSLSAQQDRVAKKMEAMHQLFDLSDAQSEQIRSVFNETAEKLGEIRSLRQSDRRAFMQKKRGIMREMEQGITAALDDNQAAEFRAMIEERRANRRAQGGRSGRTQQAPATESQMPSKTKETTEEVYVEEVSSGEAESFEEPELTPIEESPAEAESPSSSNRSEVISKALDLLYEDVIKPAVRKKR